METSKTILGTSLTGLLKNIALIVLLVIMTSLYLNEREARIEQETLTEAGADYIEILKDKNGNSIAKIQVLETQSRKDFLDYKTKDSLITELQATVKENKRLLRNSNGSASIVKTETQIDTVAVTTVVRDTISNTSTYIADIKDKWYEVRTVANADSTQIALKTFHKISLVIGTESQGLFKKSKAFAIAKDENPFSNIQDMRVYSIKQDPKQFVIGPYAGAGLSINQGIVRVGWQVGFGITYKLMEF
jgi:hypothetical protein